MSDEEILQRVKKVVVNDLSVKDEQVVPSALFYEDLHADSLEVVEITMSLEDEFGIEIPDDDLSKIKSVQDAVDYVKSKL